MMTCVSTLACAALLVALILAAHRLIDAIACAVSRRRLRAKVAAWTPPGVSWIARQQRVVVIVNPNAGAGWGDCVYEDVVRPMLRRAGIEHEVVRTTCAGMAEREAAELASRKVPVDCLLSVSGDGQLHECLNGLRGGGTGGRTALAVVPAGTGNGMSDTCFGRGSDAFEALCSILCASGPTPVDVMRLTYPDEPARTPRHDLHFFCWAAFADHDYVTENGWRWLGPLLKVALAPLYVIAQRRGYAGTVEFEPAGALEPPDPEWKREAYPYSDAAAQACGCWRDRSGALRLGTAPRAALRRCQSRARGWRTAAAPICSSAVTRRASRGGAACSSSSGWRRASTWRSQTWRCTRRAGCASIRAAGRATSS